MEERIARVSPEDRRRFERQAAALKEAETDDEGTPEWRAMMIASINERRRKRGFAPLKDWWENKGELEFREHARARGLLIPLR
ncbi:MAG: hypothetical protein ACR2HP_15270 [Ilumatobacteraceae bacterium]